MSDASAGHSDLVSNIRATTILGMELPGEVLRTLSLGLRAILMLLRDVFPHDQM